MDYFASPAMIKMPLFFKQCFHNLILRAYSLILIGFLCAGGNPDVVTSPTCSGSTVQMSCAFIPAVGKNYLPFWTYLFWSLKLSDSLCFLVDSSIGLIFFSSTVLPLFFPFFVFLGKRFRKLYLVS